MLIKLKIILHFSNLLLRCFLLFSTTCSYSLYRWVMSERKRDFFIRYPFIIFDAFLRIIYNTINLSRLSSGLPTMSSWEQGTNVWNVYLLYREIPIPHSPKPIAMPGRNWLFLTTSAIRHWRNYQFSNCQACNLPVTYGRERISVTVFRSRAPLKCRGIRS